MISDEIKGCISLKYFGYYSLIKNIYFPITKKGCLNEI